MNEIGIGILDIYGEENLKACYDSIPDNLKDSVLVAHGNANKSVNCYWKRFGDVPLATLRNWLVAEMRLCGCKYMFIIHSNQIIDNQNIFTDTIKLGKVFGSWVITGHVKDSLPLEDEVSKTTLYASTELNSQFMFILSNIISNIGYFEERFFNTKDLDVIDFLVRCHGKGLYSPVPYHITIGDGLSTSMGNITKIGFKDVPDKHRSVGLSYGYFIHKHSYLPGREEKKATQDQLLDEIQKIQEKYSIKDE